MLTKNQTWLILATVLILTQSSFYFKNSQSFYEYTVSKFALAPSNAPTSNNFNLALGLLNGTVVFTST